MTTMIDKKIYVWLVAIVMSVAMGACRDDMFFGIDDIPEGESVVKMEVAFKDFTPALTRSAGDAIKTIDRFWVVAYNPDGSLHLSKEITDFTENTTQENERPDGKPSSDEKTGHASFSLTMPNGRYRIYAVANMDLSGKDVSSEVKLRALKAEWDESDAVKNAEMFGWFVNGDKTTDRLNGFKAPLVTVGKTGTTTLHAWVCRLASKITVAYDGSRLKEGVSIYIKKLRIRNIPKSCILGEYNTVAEKGDLIDRGEEIVYSESTDFGPGYEALVTKDNPSYPRVQKEGKWVADPDRHSDNNPNTIFFYENRQGAGPEMPDKKQHDTNGDGILDELYPFEDLPCATYIEVEAYYVCTDPARPGISNITYRFMLGQDCDRDYNADRNCHYKLTLGFNGYADDPDWRIDYVTRLWVTEPKRVDYRGEYFVPDNVSSNQGNVFSNNNTFTVTSFMYINNSWTDRTPIDFKIEYRYEGSDKVQGNDDGFTPAPPGWLDGELVKSRESESDYDWQLKVNYKNEYTELPINATLRSNPSKSGTYDLSTKGGTESRNTANSYIVDSQGTYVFPLVYGNAITGGNENETSFKYQGSLTGDQYLRTFKNYKDAPIGSPYILTDIYGNNVPSGLTASVVWQDVKNLVTDVSYDPVACNGIGGIKFSVGSNIEEGNAVIALKDPSGTIMWSWHIWVTAIDLSKNITLTNHDGRQFEIMPVNLGWCSGDIPLRYYDRHECEVRITQLIADDGQEGVSQIVKIIQEPHIAVPCGNNPYYQWGRKDPFIAGGNTNKTTKKWYDAYGNENPSALPLMYSNESFKVTTNLATASLIRNPDKWQNCPHVENKNPAIPGDYVPADMIYFNLWDNRLHENDPYVVKTIYDPCPAGFHVSSNKTFTGFTDAGINLGQSNGAIEIDKNMYAATEDNMMPPKIVSEVDENAIYRDRILEFYTDKSKLISIGFPMNNYRDWDDYGNYLTFQNNDIGYVWNAQTDIWDARKYLAYHLEYNRNRYIWPGSPYYATDGMPVRPSRTL